MMIAIGQLPDRARRPAALGGGGGARRCFLILLRAVARSARAVEPLARHLADLDGAVRALNDGQQQLHGGRHPRRRGAGGGAGAAGAGDGEPAGRGAPRRWATASAPAPMRTARSLGELQQRLETIDKAQANIEKLSGNVLGLQDILSNKQTRGAFGEIQLREIVHPGAAARRRDVPGDAVERQAGRLPDPPAASAGADRHRRQVPAGGLRGAARGEDAGGGRRRRSGRCAARCGRICGRSRRNT